MSRPALNAWSRAEGDQLSISPVNMIVFTVYSDRDAPAIEKRYYFADREFRYRYFSDGVYRVFQSHLLRIEPVVESMSHIPVRDDTSALHRSATFVLRNGPFEDFSGGVGPTLLNELLTRNLIRATVEIAQVLRADDIESRDYTDKVVWFRGEVVGMPRANREEIHFTCESEKLKELTPTILNNTTKNAPEDVGLRVPSTFGSVDHHRLLGWDVPAVTTLAQPLTKTTTGWIALTDTSGLPSSGVVRIALEKINYSGNSSNEINVTARGVSATTAQNHVAGSVVAEVASTATWIIADHEVAQVNEVYVKNPLVDAIFRVDDSTQYTINLVNTTLIAGKTVATLSQTQAQYDSLMDDLAAQAAEITTQPAIGANATYTTQAGAGVVLAAPTSRTTTSPNPDSDRQNVTLLEAGISHLGISGISTTYEESRWTWQTGDGLDSVRDVKRWRLRVGGNGTAGTADGECWVRVVGVSGFTSTTSIKMWEIPNGTAVNGKSGVTAWHTPASGTKASSLAGNYVRLWIADQNASQSVEFDCYFPYDAVWMEIEYDPADVTLNTGATVTSVVMQSGAGLGYGLEWRADFIGMRQPTDSNPEWHTISMTYVANMLHWLIRVAGGGALQSGWGTFNTGSTGDMIEAQSRVTIWELGDTLEEIVQTLCTHYAVNVVQEEGVTATEYRWLCPKKDGKWDGTNAVTLTEWQDIELEIPWLNGRWTNWRVLFNLERFVGDFTEDAFKGTMIANPYEVVGLTNITTTFMTTQEAKYGRREHPAIMYIVGGDNDTDIVPVVEYWINESTRSDMQSFRIIGVPWVQALDLVRGDLVRVTPPWSSTEYLCRIIGYTKDFMTQMAELTVVTVVEAP